MADCSVSTSNALKTLVQHSTSQAGPSYAQRPVQGARMDARMNGNGMRENQNSSSQAAFFGQKPQLRPQHSQPVPFDLSLMRTNLPMAQPHSDWADAFLQTPQIEHQNMPYSVNEFMASNIATQSRSIHAHKTDQLPQMVQFRQNQAMPRFAPASTFNPMYERPQPLAMQSVKTANDLLFDQAFEEAAANATSVSSLPVETLKQTENTLVDIQGPDADTLLQKTAAHLIETVDGATNPKFANSKFLEFMKAIRDGEVGIEGNQVVEKSGGESSSAKQAPLSVSDAWVKEVGGLQGSSGFYMNDDEMFGLSEEQQRPLEWATDFTASTADAVTDENQFLGDGGETMMEEAFREFYNETGTGPAAQRLTSLPPGLLGARDREWEELTQKWRENEAQYEQGLRAGPQPRVQQRFSMDLSDSYDFIPANPYILKPIEKLRDLSTHRNLSESILSLEAAVQLDPSDATAWKNLGLRQQENENEVAAINALRKASELDPTLVDSWIALAVSYTNESLFSEAYKALGSWIQHNQQYSHLFSQKSSINNPHEFLTQVYLSAARQSSSRDLDAGIQMGLGVLFNISSEHEKAMDCFQACLRAQPDDYMLWNKLGATLANSKNATKALEAYDRALQLNPDFLRARYNVAIALIQLGSYTDAAEHLVSVLEAQERNVADIVGEDSSFDEEKLWQLHSLSSGSTWNTLSMIMDRYLNRPDLARAADQKDLSAFRK
ncbi:hypothetical protein CcCBS67573_g07934 [Chytriomyces confervae]|uniref:Uncharacterized protein n=1 Tax=Chytriomyces confervae TaxID=246404 RepID=A0A507ES98_9FUNG|nr:hypothetical protein CcCBS67573_g07934 [Chytriomyces confervae]